MRDKPENVSFEINHLSEYTDAAILAEIVRVAELLPDGPLTATRFDEIARVGRNTVARRFGSWVNAVTAAGLSNRLAEVQGARGGIQAAIHKMTDEDVLEALRGLAKRLGKSALSSRDVDEHLPFGPHTLRRRWGSSKAAYAAAGLEQLALGKRYSDEECFINLLNVWTHYGRPPKHGEMNLPPSKVGSKAYIRRFLTWRKALSAFVERVNQDSTGLETKEVTTSTDSVKEQAETRTVQRDTRDIPLGMRFNVLSRDRFKCVLCGDNPATNPGCVLHVDHILPWSKGGATSPENLRSLCKPCNLGRGNRYES